MSECIEKVKESSSLFYNRNRCFWHLFMVVNREMDG